MFNISESNQNLQHHHSFLNQSNRIIIPPDAEFLSLLTFKNIKDVEELRKAFYANTKFFFSCKDKEKILRVYKEFFDQEISKSIVEKAERILSGKIDLLGYENLDFGSPVNWNYEPLSCKQIEDLEDSEELNVRVIWELNRHQHFFTLGLAYWITEDEIFAETFDNHLDSWMEQNSPEPGINWINNLEISLRIISWLWAFRFFETSKSFSNATFFKALKFLYLQAKKIEESSGSIAEAIGLYYISTQIPFLKDSERWHQKAKRILFEQLEKQVEDDGFENSSCYAKYTADFYIHFLILHELNEASSDQKDIEKIKAKTQSLLDFLMYLTRPDGTIPSIGDSYGGKVFPSSSPNGLLSIFSTASVLFHRGDYKFIAREIAEETLWLKGIEGIKTFRSLLVQEPKFLSRFFPKSGYFIMRDGWSSTNNYLLIQNNLAPKTENSHVDNLSIDVAPLGKTTLVDPGTDIFGSDYFRSAMAHNTLSIDGKYSLDPNSQISQKDASTFCIAEDRFDFFEASNKLTLPATHKRSVLFIKNNYWIIRDFVQISGKHDYQLNFRFHYDIGSLFYKIENTAFIEEENTSSNLRIFCFGDNGDWNFTEGWVSDCYGRKRKAPVFQFLSIGIGPQEFFSFILPDSADNQKKPQVTEIEIAGGRAFLINFRDYNDFFIYSDGEAPLLTQSFLSDFRFIWARIPKNKQMPEEYVLVDGKKFWLNGRQIINHPQKLKFAIARLVSNKLNVRTYDTIFTVSMPQMNKMNPV
jgi:hypothetical protein